MTIQNIFSSLATLATKRVRFGTSLRTAHRSDSSVPVHCWTPERKARSLARAIALAIFGVTTICSATPSTDPAVLARRGKAIGGTGTTAPVMTLTKPEGGWTSALQAEIAGTCSDTTADPVEVNINGTRYFIRSVNGAFSRKFPLAPGKNTVIAECRNPSGVGRASAVVDAVVSTIPLKIVLTSDTDGVYTDLHIYEPDGHHVYWASTRSPSGGIFYLNEQSGSFDQPGYGPYLFVHTNPPPGVYRIDANYWPGGAIAHTLASLDVIVNEGTPEEFRRRIHRPLARPDETQTLAYVVFRANRLPPVVYVPGQDPETIIPEEVVRYQRDIEPNLKKDGSSGEEYASLAPADESAMRTAVTRIALEQAHRMSPMWEPAQRDCAGLVRFAFREALRERTPDQLRALGIPRRLQIPPVSYSARRIFPYYPNIWERGLESVPVKDRFTAFADAETLTSFNLRLKSHSVDGAEPGDILLYRRIFTGEEPYHMMVFGATRPQPVVVYHTGDPASTDAVRVVRVDELFRSQDPAWVPVPENPNFLGIYEWKRFRKKSA